MFNIKCNIDNDNRVARIVIGIVLCLGVMLGLPKFFFFLLGAILIAEGAIGWCGIPIMMKKWQQSQKK